MLREWLPYIVIGVVAAALIVLTLVLSRLAWRRQVRRYLVGLLGRREAIGAAMKTLDATVGQLARATVKDLVALAAPDSEERRTFAEIGSRMRIEAGELAALPLPKKLWPLADALGSAATALADQAGRVGDANGEAALDALIALDLAPARASLADADVAIADLSGMYDLSDPSVYGGGLYI